MALKSKLSWIYSLPFDTLFVLGPPFFCILLISLFPSFFQNQNQEPEWLWLFLVVFIDVGHVYSTIYRTYFDKAILATNKSFFYLSPVLIYLTGVLLHSFDPAFFWRAMAYLAVFHFVRQQYGFMRLYSRHESHSLSTKIDTVTIYSATIYPLLYWHFSGQQSFNWFIEGDFFYLNNSNILPFLNVVYVAILISFLGKEIYYGLKTQTINIPKNLLIAGTALSWYLGIVYFKGDLTFTLLNVVSHGIPYYALVWAYGNKKSKGDSFKSSHWLKKLFKPQYLAMFLLILLALAYFEELVWDGLVWKEHFTLFPTSNFLPDISNNKILLSLCIPLLALPQVLHYFIDGFIWKMKKDSFDWFKFIK